MSLYQPATVYRSHLGELYVPVGHALDLQTGDERLVLRHLATGKLNTVSLAHFTGRVPRGEASVPCFWPDAGSPDPPEELVKRPEIGVDLAAGTDHTAEG